MMHAQPTALHQEEGQLPELQKLQVSEDFSSTSSKSVPSDLLEPTAVTEGWKSIGFKQVH